MYLSALDTVNASGTLVFPTPLALPNLPSIAMRTDSVITGVKEELAHEIPDAFTLDQNYPNPFNPIAEIGFRIADRSHVNITVYDLLGRAVATLVDEEKAPGSYTVTFPARGGSASGGNASNLSSGTYIYRLTAGGYTATRRMMLVK
jgi:hypothetical protein